MQVFVRKPVSKKWQGGHFLRAFRGLPALRRAVLRTPCGPLQSLPCCQLLRGLLAKRASLPEPVEGACLQRDITSTGSATAVRHRKKSVAPCACRRGVAAKRHRFDGLSERYYVGGYSRNCLLTLTNYSGRWSQAALALRVSSGNSRDFLW